MKRISSLTFLALLFLAPAAVAKEKECCWIDVKTGKQVATAPLSGVNIGGIHEHATAEEHSVAIVSGDRKTAHNSYNGKSYARDPDGCWIDVKTGKQVATAPLSGVNIGGIHEHATAEEHSIAIVSGDRKTAHNSYNGKSYALVPCPPPGQATGETLKKVFDSVHIGIGIGGGYSSGHDERHHGEDRHRTADKVSTDKTKTHTTSPTTTHKTVTAGCKCHPCTCSPCTCH